MGTLSGPLNKTHAEAVKRLTAREPTRQHRNHLAAIRKGVTPKHVKVGGMTLDWRKREPECRETNVRRREQALGAGLSAQGQPVPYTALKTHLQTLLNIVNLLASSNTERSRRRRLQLIMEEITRANQRQRQ